jgi:hypothetical protein
VFFPSFIPPSFSIAHWVKARRRWQCLTISGCFHQEFRTERLEIGNFMLHFFF